MIETRKRSLAKAFSYRVIGTVTTTLIALFLTGAWDFALEIGLIDTGVKLFVFFAHERVWLLIPYGKIQRRDYQI